MARGRDRLTEILRTHKRVAIVGGPKTGKTTLSQGVTDRPVLHTDDNMAQPWEDQPHIIIAQADGKESFVVEGVQAGRALRKGLEVDAVVVLNQPKVTRTEGQERMAKGCDKILRDWESQSPGVPVYRIEDER